jgi:hypothetical protein
MLDVLRTPTPPKSTTPPDPFARQRELIATINDDKADSVARYNARQTYVETIPAGERLLQIMPSSDERRLIQRECSAHDARDSSAVAMAAQRREFWQVRYPALFVGATPATPLKGPATPYSFDEISARHALAAHLQRMAAIAAIVKRITELGRQASDADQRVTTAKQVVAGIDQAEHEQWLVWQRDTTQPHPAPHTAARATALAELSTHEKIASATRAACDAATDDYVRAVKELARLQGERDAYVSQVAACVLPELMAAKQRADESLAQVAGAIDGIRIALNKLGADTGGIFDAATHQREQNRKQNRGVADRGRQRIAAWVERLSGDPTAIIEDIPS